MSVHPDDALATALLSGTEAPSTRGINPQYSVSKGMVPDPSATARSLAADQLGASGAPSATRSVITKSFRSGRQGGFDRAGDDAGALEKLTLSSVRPSTAVSMISMMTGADATGREEDPEEVRYACGCCGSWNGIPLTNNVKALFVMMVLFAVISLAQYFAATAVKSQALTADVISMAVDAVSYLGNIFGESSDIPAQRTVLQLVFSLLSLFLLYYFNTTTLIDSVEILKGVLEEGAEEGPASEGTIVIIFAGLGLLFDFICLYFYRHFAKKDAEKEYKEMLKQASEEDSADLNQNIKKPQINMLSALLHVSADLFRSTSTFILGILLVADVLTDNQQAQGDAILAIIIGATIYLAALYATVEWFIASYKWFTALGQVIEVECPEGIGPGDIIRIQPQKVGHGSAGDAFAL